MVAIMPFSWGDLGEELTRAWSVAMVLGVEDKVEAGMPYRGGGGYSGNFIHGVGGGPVRKWLGDDREGKRLFRGVWRDWHPVRVCQWQIPVLKQCISGRRCGGFP